MPIDILEFLPPGHLFSFDDGPAPGGGGDVPGAVLPTGPLRRALLAVRDAQAPFTAHLWVLPTVVTPGMEVGGITEASYPGYASQAVTFGDPVANAVSALNATAALTWGPPSGTSAAGTQSVGGYYVLDAGGNLAGIYPLNSDGLGNLDFSNTSQTWTVTPSIPGGSTCCS